MWKSITWVLSVCLIVAAPAVAEDTKPLAVLSLTSHSDANFNPSSVDFVADADEMPTWLSSTLQLFAEGRGVWGLDASRPWGAVVQRTGSALSAYAFIPVDDPEGLAWELSDYIESQTEVAYGIYRIVGTEPGKQLYAREANGWLFVSDCPKCLATVNSNPIELLDDMHKQYDVALRISVKNVPAREGDKILSTIDSTLGTVLRKKLSGQSMNILGEAAFALDEVTLGWSKK